MRLLVLLFFSTIALAQEPAPLNPHTFQPYPPQYYQPQWRQWPTAPHTNPNPQGMTGGASTSHYRPLAPGPRIALPPSLALGGCPVSLELPTPSPETLRELADMVASAVHFHSDTGQLAADALGRYAANSRYAPAVTNALLTALNRAGGVAEIGDRGDLMRMIGVSAAFLPENSPLFQRAEGELRRAMTLASAGAKFRDEVLNPDSDHPAAHMLRSAAAGWEALAVAGKVKGPQLAFLAGIPVPEAAHALATALDAASPDERREAVQRFFTTAAQPAFAKVRGLALRAMAKYVDRPAVSQAITAFNTSLDVYRRDPKKFDPEALGVLQVIQNVATTPEVQELARGALQRAGVHGERSKEAIDSLLSHARTQLGTDREAARADLEGLNKEILDLGIDVVLDVAGAFDPTPICDGINCVRAIRRGDYLSATLSAVAMLPYVGDGIIKPLKLGNTAAKVMKVAAQAERLINKLAKINQRFQQFKSIAEFGVNAVDSLSRGELPPADDSLALLARMAKHSRKLQSISGTLQSVRNDYNALQNGECPTRAAGFVERLQRSARRPFEWLDRRTAPAQRFVARGAMPEEETTPAPQDRAAFVAERIRAMGLTPAQSQWAQLKIAQTPDASSRDILQILLEAKYPAS